MKKQLQGDLCHCRMNTRRVYNALYILLFIICGAAHSQPMMLSSISNDSKNFIFINNQLYYSVADSLYASTPNSTPSFVVKTGEPILAIYDMTVGSNFFFVTQSSSGQSLWRTDGTSAQKITTQTQITPLLSFQSQLFMRVNAAASGTELWKVDASFNASIVKDIYVGSQSGFRGRLIEHDNLLYFFADDGSGVDLWQSNGTTGGTVIAAELDDTEFNNSSGFYDLTSVDDVMFFTRNYEGHDGYSRIAELWKSDGTTEGTSMVIQYTTDGTYNDLSHLIAFEGKLYFFHNIGDPAFHYISVSDGTESGTVHLDRTSIDGAARELIYAGDYLLFYAESQSFTTPIQKTDGTAISTVHAFSFYHSTQDELIDLTYTEGRAFFLDDVTEYYGGGSSLWQADLASGVTQPVEEIYDLPMNGSGNIVAADGSIFFTRMISGQMSLWYYDPSEPPGSTPCAGNGSIEREEWADIEGYNIWRIPVDTEPTSVTTLYSFTTQQNTGDNYGARVRGYICAPQNGNYVFYISGDDNTELWLSTDDNPENKRLIASSKWTRYNEWSKYPTQQSEEIPLVTGTRYYIEALHKEAAGADHLSVGWKLPDGTLERPIPGVRLIPYRDTSSPQISFTQPSDGASFVAPTNIDIAATAEDPDGAIVNVSFYVDETLLAEDENAPYTYQWQNVPAGNYTIEARATDNDGNTKSTFRNITVTPPACTSTGSIVQELWVNVSGSDVRTFDFSTNPNGGTRSFNSFETTQYYANNYASRMKAYLCVPQTGNYTFWISSDDYSELYLSSDDSEANKELIAWVYGHTPFRNYDKYPSQKSVQIMLEAGRQYYIEARHKEGGGNDFVSVGWQLPDGSMERPIPGNRLITITPIPNEPCVGSGAIVREIWNNVPGTSVSMIPVSSPPDVNVSLSSLSTQNYYGNEYGSRIRGYICVPVSGAYTFWISGDDNSELWLSDDDDPSTKERIAYVSGATRVNEWNKFSTQVSNSINLVEGQRYYIEILHKEGGGADHVEVGWQLPTGEMERPIPGNRLIPFEDMTMSATRLADYDSEVQGIAIDIYPNPVERGKQFILSIPVELNEDVEIDIISLTGVSLQNEKVTANDGQVAINLNSNIVPGMYLLKASGTKWQQSNKLQVK